MNNPNHGRSRRVLIIEGDSSLRELMADILGEAGYVAIAESHPIDPSEVDRLGPDIVLLDIPLGKEVAAFTYISRLSSESKANALPVLALSAAYPRVDVSRWPQEVGVAGVVHKPFELQSFVDAVESALHESRPSTPSPVSTGSAFQALENNANSASASAQAL